MSNKINKIIILGCGVSGMSLAYYLKNLINCEIIILERSTNVGGLSSGIFHNGYFLDYGPHVYHPANDEFDELFIKLCDNNDFIQSRNVKLLLDDLILDYPLSIGQVLDKYDIMTNFQFVADYLIQQLKNIHLRKPSFENFEDWGISTFGKSIYEKCFGVYSRKVWGIEPNQISTMLVNQRLKGLSLVSVILSTLTKGKRKSSKSYFNSFIYNKMGIQNCWDNFEVMLIKKGITIYKDFNIKYLFYSNQIISKIISDDTELSIGTDDLVISTLPIDTLINDILSPKIVNSSLDYVGLHYIYYFLSQPRLFDEHWIYLLDKKIVPNRISDLNNINNIHKLGCLCLEISDHNYDGSIHNFDYIRSLSSIGLKEKLITDIKKSYYLHSYPLFKVGFENELQKVLFALSKIRNLITTGRQGLFLNIDIHDCFMISKYLSNIISESNEMILTRFYEPIISKFFNQQEFKRTGI